ncbi:MAG: zinc-binding dehydrogenase [Elusimicrobia bacterium]|nr:zinc-binding dehydrogenase [Elusimicrobiota bacterium]
MKAAFFNQCGGADQLTYGDFEDPVAAAGEVLVRVKACALNHLDLWVREGLPAYKIRLPHILGNDIAGTLAETGQNVLISPGISCFKCGYCLRGSDNLCPDYKIIGADGGHGGYAEWVRVPAANVIPIPEGVALEEAAAFPLTYLTAWHMLSTRAELKTGQSVLVLGSGSGVGVAAIQIAKLLGARVLAASSSQAKLGRAKALGADETIWSGGENLAKKIVRFTQGEGVDVVFEHIGSASFMQAVKCLKRGGVLVTCGATGGHAAELDLRYVYFKELKILGARMGTFAELNHIVQFLAQKRLKPVIDRRFALSEARQAHEYLASRLQFGKVVLIP